MLKPQPLSDNNTTLRTTISLIEDYQAHGLLTRSQTVRSIMARGRIDWGRTISKQQAIVADNGILYEHPVYRLRRDDVRNPVRLIHAYCVSRGYEEWGWLVSPDGQCQQITQSLPCSVSESITILERELTSVYTEREKRVINLLILYLSANDVTRSNHRIDALGTFHFQTVWEAICKYLFADSETLRKKVLSKPRWNMVDGHIKDLAQIPDILTKLKETLVVLDAKYYDSKSNLPGWQDVVKQIYYQDSINRKMKSDRALFQSLGVAATSNAYVFPGPPKTGFTHIGDSEVPITTDRIETWGRIPAFSMDIEESMSDYASFRRDPSIYGRYLRAVCDRPALIGD